jgi:fructose-bisphosphate aldolase class II
LKASKRLLVKGSELLAQAVGSRRAVGSFNTYNLEITRAILRAAEAQKQPVFLAAGTGALDFAGFIPFTRAMLAAAEEATVPVAVHLDHSPDVGTVSRCIAAGFTSVMIDGSMLPFDENVALTREAVSAARGCTVEAELGGVAGAEDVSGDQTTMIPMTDPEQAAAFVAKTGVDGLAVAIGNAHGFYSGEPRLDFERLAALAQSVPVPLVLHGASGIPDADIGRCIELGIRKINVNTEIRHALFESLQDSLHRGVRGYDLTRLFGDGVEAMQRVVEEKIRLFAGG